METCGGRRFLFFGLGLVYNLDFGTGDWGGGLLLGLMKPQH